eukprot:269651-Chlamydomonas_euryale.AAC.1
MQQSRSGGVQRRAPFGRREDVCSTCRAHSAPVARTARLPHLVRLCLQHALVVLLLVVLLKASQQAHAVLGDHVELAHGRRHLTLLLKVAVGAAKVHLLPAWKGAHGSGLNARVEGGTRVRAQRSSGREHT